MADLAAPGDLRNDNVVPSRGHLVARVREREHGRRDPPREIPAEGAGHKNSGEKRGEEAPNERQPALVQESLPSREDDRAEDLAAELDGPGDCEEPGVSARRCEFEPNRLSGKDAAKVD